MVKNKKKEVVKEPKEDKITKLLSLVEEIQENQDFINDEFSRLKEKINKISGRLGLDND